MADVAPRNRIDQVAVPVLLIHGDADSFIPPANLEALYARAHPERTQRWLVPGHRHSDVILDPGYGSRVIEFLSEHLSVGQVRDTN